MTLLTLVVRPGRKDALDPRIFDAGRDEERLDEFEAEKYIVGGREVKLYRISAFAAMLGRSPITIRKWETSGVLPSTPFRLIFDPKDLRGSRRKFTREQILGTVRIAREEGILIMFEGQVKRTNFTSRVRALFDSLTPAQKAA